MSTDKFESLREEYLSLAKKLKLSDKFLKLDDEKLLALVSGGAFTGSSDSYQVYYQGNPLPMDQTVAQLCNTYPQIKTALSSYYMLVANKTLNELCATFGEEFVQNLIDTYG